MGTKQTSHRSDSSIKLQSCPGRPSETGWIFMDLYLCHNPFLWDKWRSEGASDDCWALREAALPTSTLHPVVHRHHHKVGAKTSHGAKNNWAARQETQNWGVGLRSERSSFTQTLGSWWRAALTLALALARPQWPTYETARTVLSPVTGARGRAACQHAAKWAACFKMPMKKEKETSQSHLQEVQQKQIGADSEAAEMDRKLTRHYFKSAKKRKSRSWWTEANSRGKPGRDRIIQSHFQAWTCVCFLHVLWCPSYM